MGDELRWTLPKGEKFTSESMYNKLKVIGEFLLHVGEGSNMQRLLVGELFGMLSYYQ